jgi:peptidoglycan/xylan/chitin deacetylase (PgdA/CDA1 family)
LNNKNQNSASIITFYHDIEQNFDSQADPAECRQMVSEFLKLEKKYNISSTYNVVGKLFIDQPDLVDSITKEGQEVAFHSFNHQTDWNPAYYSNEIELCRKVSKIPTGYRSPRSQITPSAVKDIWKNGFLWNAEGDYHTEPYYIYKGLVRLPIAGDDWSLYLGHVSADKWVQNFIKLLKSRTYVAFGLHDYIASADPEKILQAWEKILQIAVESGALLLNLS